MKSLFVEVMSQLGFYGAFADSIPGYYDYELENQVRREVGQVY